MAANKINANSIPIDDEHSNVRQQKKLMIKKI